MRKPSSVRVGEDYTRFQKLSLSVDLEQRLLDLKQAIQPFLENTPSKKQDWFFLFLLERKYTATKRFIEFNRSLDGLKLHHQLAIVDQKIASKNGIKTLSSQSVGDKLNVFVINSCFSELLFSKKKALLMLSEQNFDARNPHDSDYVSAELTKVSQKLQDENISNPKNLLEVFLKEWLEQRREILMAKLMEQNSDAMLNSDPETMKEIDAFLLGHRSRRVQKPILMDVLNPDPETMIEIDAFLLGPRSRRIQKPNLMDAPKPPIKPRV